MDFPARPLFCQFEPIRAWELAHLSLLVHDHDTFGTNELLCGASIELRALRRGLRFVPLSNAQGALIPGCGLLCQFDW